MKSLIMENRCKERWYPTAIDRYRTYIKLDMTIDGSEQLRNNIAYNLQYLEYIQKQQNELNLSSVIYVMLCKSYIISGMGIIEGLFSNLLKSKGLWNSTVWESKRRIKSNESVIDGKKIKIETEIFEKVDAYEMRMDLDSMIKKIESKKLLSIEHKNFPIIKKLRGLRNRVHLQQANNRFDTDYHNFSYEEKNEMGEILYTILTDEIFCTMPQYPEIFEFLKNK
ncbi:hypothetical protein [Oceanirhabdus sp. W0125-5]|uniref:hypothetical protein n=1 Tax=Oceanirhabdus sp. W0125-5 TaxID=2999116 RepID=UPI0022F307CD|nr:hypothetical protein [Oceanirhabdus sp. W0125-5]WBW98837.1 hypothetical protein OW730_08875 [Oceanirhabdus sp. W0125-5]